MQFPCSLHDGLPQAESTKHCTNSRPAIMA
jgi:hypothetical protein